MVDLSQNNFPAYFFALAMHLPAALHLAGLLHEEQVFMPAFFLAGILPLVIDIGLPYIILLSFRLVNTSRLFLLYVNDFQGR